MDKTPAIDLTILKICNYTQIYFSMYFVGSFGTMPSKCKREVGSFTKETLEKALELLKGGKNCRNVCHSEIHPAKKTKKGTYEERTRALPSYLPRLGVPIRN